MNGSSSLRPLAVANAGSIEGRLETAGMLQGSDDEARKVAEGKITGVRYRPAIGTASTAVSKQPPGVLGAITGSGDSPCRAYSAISRSDCSVFVGIPVDGPARCTSTMIIGS